MALSKKVKPLYQPWQEEAFYSDVYVRAMTPTQRWMYRTLLQSMFFHTTRPYLPNDDDILWVLAGCESKEQWMENKAVVLRRFQPVRGNDKLLKNNRVCIDWNRVMKERKRFSELGKESARRRAEKSATDAQRTLNERRRSEVKGSEVKKSSNSGKAASAGQVSMRIEDDE